MAIISTDTAARLQFKDAQQKTICTYSSIRPAASADDIALFAEALETLQGRSFAFTYLIVQSELHEEP